MKRMFIALDFDGTLTTHEYPKIGRTLENMLHVIDRLKKKDHKLVLNTMRSGHELAEAVDWCKENGIELFGINSNPSQSSWTASPKVYAHVYIDDAALGTPLNYYSDGTRPSVDWFAVEKLLEERSII